MAEPKAPRRPFNRVVHVGMWMTLAVILFWAGGEAFVKVESYLPWVLAVSVLILILGLLMHYRQKPPTNGAGPSSSA